MTRMILAFSAALCLWSTDRVRADVIFEVAGLPATISAGTPTVTFDLVVTGTNAQAGASFDGAVYAVGATSSGAVTNFVGPPVLTGIATGYDLDDQPSPPNVQFGNVFAPLAGPSANLSGAVLSMTLDTSGLVAGDTVAFDLGVNGLGEVTAGGTAFTGVTGSASFSVVPEPSSILMVGFGSLCLAFRRRSKLSWS